MVTTDATEPKNLDLDCAKTAANIAKEVKDEGIINKALGVLQEDGVYAFFLYLLSLEKKKDGKKARDIIDPAAKLLKCQGLITIETVDKKSVQNLIPELNESLEKLFLAKDLLERTLIYARYHAKAYEKKTGT